MSDLISRQAAIEAIKCAIWDKQIAKDAIDAVCNIPSTQPERKKGKWHRRFYPHVEMIVCSECQEEFSYDAETGVRDYNYCPNCGASMMKGADDAVDAM